MRMLQTDLLKGPLLEKSSSEIFKDKRITFFMGFSKM